MVEKIQTYMERYAMLPENGNIVAGVSGGPDSVCLLLVLVRLCRKYGLRLAVVHMDHGLRPEAGEDAAFVQKLCAQWQAEFVLARADVAALAGQKGISCEEAGRLVRYSAFEEQLVKMDALTGGHGCIAVAHNREDRAETFLFHLLRGTGLDGMAGIRPVRFLHGEAGPRIIRPLLETGREEIEAFLREEGIGWRTDATNAQDLYTRNRIRNHILPYAEAQISRGAKLHLAREAALLEETADFVRDRMLEALERCRLPQEGTVKSGPAAQEICLSAEKLRQEVPFVQKLCVRECLQRAGQEKNLTAAHVEAAWALSREDCQSGRRLSVPACRVEACRVFDTLVFRPLDKENGTKAQELFIPLEPGSFEVPGLGRVEARLLPGPAQNTEKEAQNASFFKNIPEKKYTKWLDYGKIIESAGFRTRRTGDYLTVNDALARKSLKRYMIEEKIPADERAKRLVLADGAHVVWVPGYRISTAYKVTAQTAVILEISCSAARAEEKQNTEEENLNMAERVEVLLTEKEVDDRIQAIGDQISKDYAGKQVHLVCVLKGGSFFMCELAKRITVPVSLDFMSVSSYGGDTKSSGVIRIVKDLDESLKDKDVIVVEDIVDSGRTLSYLLKMLQARGPRSLALCTLLDKPDRRVVDVNVNYTGFQIPDEFVVGYGLDYDQRYRNLPYIGVVKFD